MHKAMGSLIFKKDIILFLSVVLMVVLQACAGEGRQPGNNIVLVFKHGKIAGDPHLFRDLLTAFETENPGISIQDETLPSSTDEQHQFYVINLEGRSADFDVLSMDVIWVPEFARAGWLLDISAVMTVEDAEDFFSGPLEAVTYNGAVYALPWYIDAGVLYYRKDLLSKYGWSPPGTWDELVACAQKISSKETGLYGFVWQGKQYEGLVCNALEYCWSNGGTVLHDGEIMIESPANSHALQFMRDLIVRYRVTPPLVSTATEETTRHLFGNGNALFMRNWPYAWHLFEQPGSRVKGLVGVSMLPSFPGHEPAATLGGWQLGINKHSRHPAAAQKLIQYLTSPGAQKHLALRLGYKPARKSLYRDRDLIRQQPFMVSLYDVFMQARPRPVTPYYMMLSQVMQPAFSAVISGIETPAAALNSARVQMEHILEGER
jgi:multiple sugar transport system substrate-binding protein